MNKLGMMSGRKILDDVLFILLILGMLLSVGMNIWGMDAYVSKKECEIELPDSVSCVWTVPEGFKND